LSESASPPAGFPRWQECHAAVTRHRAEHPDCDDPPPLGQEPSEADLKYMALLEDLYQASHETDWDAVRAMQQREIAEINQGAPPKFRSEQPDRSAPTRNGDRRPRRRVDWSRRAETQEEIDWAIRRVEIEQNHSTAVGNRPRSDRLIAEKRKLTQRSAHLRLDKGSARPRLDRVLTNAVTELERLMREVFVRQHAHRGPPDQDSDGDDGGPGWGQILRKLTAWLGIEKEISPGRR
jgi:hypothetical protein